MGKLKTFSKVIGESQHSVEMVKSLFKPGDKIKIDFMVGEPQYSGKTGEVEYIDDIGQIHGSWGGCALIYGEDHFHKIE